MSIFDNENELYLAVARGLDLELRNYTLASDSLEPKQIILEALGKVLKEFQMVGFLPTISGVPNEAILGMVTINGGKETVPHVDLWPMVRLFFRIDTSNHTGVEATRTLDLSDL